MSDTSQREPVLGLISWLQRRLLISRLLRAACTGLWWSALTLAMAVAVHYLWQPLPAVAGVGLAAVPLLAAVVVEWRRGRQQAGQVARLADRRLQADSLLLSAWDLARRERPSIRGAGRLVLARAGASLPAWQSALREQFPVVRPPTLPLAVVAVGAAALLLQLPGAPLEQHGVDLAAAAPPPAPWLLEQTPAESPSTAPVAAAGQPDADSTRGDAAAPAPHATDTGQPPATAGRQLPAMPPGDPDPGPGRLVAADAGAGPIDPAGALHQAPAADQVGDAAAGQDAGSRPVAAVDLTTQFVDIGTRSAGPMSADPTAPGGDLGASRHVPVGSGTLSGVAAARAPQLPAADIGLAPALQAYVADFVARTHAASSQ